MRKFYNLLIFISIALFSGIASSAQGENEGLEEGLVNPGYQDKPDWFVESFLDLREDLADANSEKRQLLLYFYQDGCPYCEKLLNENFTLSAIVEKTRKRFNVIAINIWGDREVLDLKGNTMTEKDFARHYRVMYTPTMLFLGREGQLVLRLDGYYPPHEFDIALDFASGGARSGERFRSYLVRVNPEPASGKLHHENDYLRRPLQLDAAARSGRPLAVFFEQRQCSPCDELHEDILKRTEVAKSLQAFDVALVDIWSGEPLVTPLGKRTTAAKWARELDIKYAPAIVFFDRSGNEIFRTEAYLRAFHTQAAFDYISSGAYLDQPSFQRYIQARADDMRARGIEVDIMK